MQLTLQEKRSNYDTYVKYLNKLIGEATTSDLIQFLGGSEKFIDATYATTIDSGLAYNGSFIKTILEMCDVATKINEILPEEKQVSNASIYRTILLCQISKVEMFVPNDNDWEIKNRGMLYKFNELEGALRMGERSLYYIMPFFIKLTPYEFEAIRILDKDTTNDTYSKSFSGTLATIVKQAAEIIDIKYNTKRK